MKLPHNALRIGCDNYTGLYCLFIGVGLKLMAGAVPVPDALVGTGWLP